MTASRNNLRDLTETEIDLTAGGAAFVFTGGNGIGNHSANHSGNGVGNRSGGENLNATNGAAGNNVIIF